jgi:hypothetical protein
MRKGWERDMIGLINDLPKDKEGPSGHAQNSAQAQAGARAQDGGGGGGGVLQKIILLTMPVLSLHLNILGSIKNNITKGHKAAALGRDDSGNEGSIIDHLHRFAAVELHAIAMIFDKPGKLRSTIDVQHQEKLQTEIKEISNKVATGSVSLIEAQEKVIQNLMDVMTKIKNGKSA